MFHPFFFIIAFASYSQPSYEPFINFFKPLVGKWSCTINDYEEATGKSSWQETQNREFFSVLNGNYLMEKAYSPHFFEEKAVGMFIYSYDITNKTVFSTGFWIGTGGHLFEVQAKIVDQTRCEGKMKIKNEDGTFREHNVEWSWPSANKFQLTVYRKGTNGTFYLGEQLIYTRVTS